MTNKLKELVNSGYTRIHNGDYDKTHEETVRDVLKIVALEYARSLIPEYYEDCTKVNLLSTISKDELSLGEEDTTIS